MKKILLPILTLFTTLATAQQVTTFAGFTKSTHSMAKIIFFISFFYALSGFSQTVSTLAGTTYGYNDGPGEFAQFWNPNGICADAQGNLFVADKSNNRIRKITPSGEVSTIAGSTEGYQDGVGTNAKFNFPQGICIDALGNLYVTELFNFKIRKITADGTVSTIAGSTQGFADGTGTAAQFSWLGDICIDPLGNLFVADAGNNKIRKITPAGVVTTFAGTTDGYLDGTVSTAKFSYPNGICLDSQGNFYIVDTFNRRIRKISNMGVVTTIAGSTWGNEDGQGTAAKFDFPISICRDVTGNLFVTDASNHNIRKIAPSGYVSTYAGSTNDVSGNLDGDIDTALFCSPLGIMTTVDCTIYVTQACGNPSVRKITSILNIENFINSKMVLYPNPNEGTFEINLNETINIEIYNSLGSLVYAKKNVLKQIETNLLSGIYYVKISNTNNNINYLRMIIR
jgi:sugar lactone lactonase YvrE